MKKIIVATSVILVILLSMLVALGLKLNSLSNSLVETENAIQELKRSAASDSAKDANVEADTMSFTEDSLKLTEYVNEHRGTEYLTVGDVISDQVRVDHSGYMPVIRYKNGMPKIVVKYDINGKTMLGKIIDNYLFFDQSGRVIAHGHAPFLWTCSRRGNDKAPMISGSNPNMCRDFYVNKSN